MFHGVRFKVFAQRILALIMMLIVVLSLGILSPTMARPSREEGAAQAKPDAGTWKTWVLDSGSQFKADTPPDETATQKEIAQLKDMVAKRDNAALMQIAYWNAGPPAYHWNQIAINKLIAGGAAGNMAFRDLALMHVAIYDATVAAWNSKYVYNRQRPSEVDSALTTVIPNPSNPYGGGGLGGGGLGGAGLAFPGRCSDFQG